jgi:5-formyltetrahydrofolate cyclo-ligase
MLLHDDEVLDAVPAQPHDRPVDVIVTPTRTLVIR